MVTGTSAKLDLSSQRLRPFIASPSRTTDCILLFDHKKWQGDLNSDKPVPLQGIDVLILERDSGYESNEN